MCSISWFYFFAEAQDAQELIKNHELNFYVSRDRLSQAIPKLPYVGEHSEVSQAWSLHACWTRMLYNDRLETIDKSQSTNSAKTLKSILCVRLTTKVKVGLPESFKVGWYPPPKKKLGRVILSAPLFEIRRAKILESLRLRFPANKKRKLRLRVRFEFFNFV